MADGAIFGKRRAWGSAAHSNGSATVIAQLSVPASPDAYYHVTAEIVTGGSNSTQGVVGTVRGRVVVDGGAISVGLTNFDKQDGGSSYDATLDIDSGNVRVLVTAAANRRSGAELVMWGFEQAITLA